MEGPKSMDGNMMRFDAFRDNIAEIFKKEGLSENLNLLIENWNNTRYVGVNTYFGSSEQRISLQMELAEIYGVTERYDGAYEILSDVWTYAYKTNLSDLVKEIENLMDSILGKK